MLLLTGYLLGGAWLLRDGKAAISAACCCNIVLVCLPRIPHTLYCELVFSGSLAGLSGVYSLTWHEEWRCWVGIIPSGTYHNINDIWIVLTEDQGSLPQKDPGINNGGTIPDHLCLLFSLRCGGIDGPFLNTYVASVPGETHDPISGHWFFDVGLLSCFDDTITTVENVTATVAEDPDDL